jgi:hypothetical protein
VGQYRADVEVGVSFAVFIGAEKSLLWFAGRSIGLIEESADEIKPDNLSALKMAPTH